MTEPLTPTELRVLRAYLVTGSVRDAAQELGRAPSTVRHTLGRVS